MKEWMEQGFGVMVIGGIIGVGLLVRMVLFGYYVKLGKACKKIRTTKNKSLQYIKEGLKKHPTAGKEIKNVLVYTECRLAECRLLGIYVGTWEGVMEQSLLLVLLSSGLCALVAVICESAKEQILACLFLGGTGGVAVIVLDMLSGMKARYRRIRLQIRDYIENCRWSDDAEEVKAEVIAVELPEQNQKNVTAKKAKSQKIKLQKIKKSHGKAQEEKRRLTEELLRDRRCLEAQRFAERREKEKETEQIQADEEAAATTVGATTVEAMSPASVIKAEPVTEVQEETEMSYEVLLRNVLAEYLG